MPLAGLVAGRAVPPAMDRLPPSDLLPHSPLLHGLLDLAARFLPRVTPVAVLALAVVCWLAGARRAAFFSLLAPGCAYAATLVLKDLLARPSADGTGWMFPSGHVTVVSAVATVLAVLLLRDGVLGERLPRRLLPPARVLTLLAAATTSVATVLQRHHYPTDVAGGILTALIMVLLVAILIDRIPQPLS